MRLPKEIGAIFSFDLTRFSERIVGQAGKALASALTPVSTRASERFSRPAQKRNPRRFSSMK